MNKVIEKRSNGEIVQELREGKVSLVSARTAAVRQTLHLYTFATRKRKWQTDREEFDEHAKETVNLLLYKKGARFAPSGPDSGLGVVSGRTLARVEED